MYIVSLIACKDNNNCGNYQNFYLPKCQFYVIGTLLAAERAKESNF